LPRAKGIRVAEWLLEQRIDRVACREDPQGRGPVYALREVGVELVHSDARTLDEVIASGRDLGGRG